MLAFYYRYNLLSQKKSICEEQQAHIQRRRLTVNKKATLETRSQVLKAAHMSRTKKAKGS